MIRIYLEGPETIQTPLRKHFDSYQKYFSLKTDPANAQYVIVASQQAELQAHIDRLAPGLGDRKLWVCTPAKPKSPLVANSMAPGTWNPETIGDRILADLALVLPPNEVSRHDVLGISLTKILDRMERFAHLDEPVLLRGETGVGKNLFAYAVHKASPRAKHDILQVNSAEFPGDRLAAELFGHEPGAFTDAKGPREGLLRAVGPGSFFLDEIGDLAKDQQARILSVVDDRRVRPLGGDVYVPIEARFIFATLQNLETMVQEKHFREDLYHRLDVCQLIIPPVRECRADVLLLAGKFLDQINRKLGTELLLTPPCKDIIFNYDWPGNVRQIRNVITKVAGLSDGVFDEKLLLESLKQKLVGQKGGGIDINPGTETWDDIQNMVKSIYFRKLLAKHPSKKEAAIQAGISKARMYEIAKELDL